MMCARVCLVIMLMPVMAISADAPDSPSAFNFWTALIGGNAASVDPKELDSHLHSGEANILQPDEHVEGGVRTVRDYLVVTSKRILVIDVKDLGYKIQYRTVSPKTIYAFSARTAGLVDWDSELTLLTVDGGAIRQDIKKGEDIVAFQRLVAKLLLKNVTATEEVKLEPSFTLGGFFGGFFEDVSAVGSGLHSGPTGALLEGENVLAAVKTTGPLFVLTPLRMMLVTVAGDQGNLTKIQYESIPYASVRSFAVKASAQKDSPQTAYLVLYTAQNTYSLTVPFGQDILGLQRIISSRILATAGPHIRAERPVGHEGWLAGAFGGFSGKADELGNQLRTKPFDVLLPSEEVEAAFMTKSGSILLLTQLRVLRIVPSSAGFSYTSIVYAHIDDFSVDFGSEGSDVGNSGQTFLAWNGRLTLTTSSTLGTINEEIRTGMNLGTLHKMLTTHILV